MDRHTNVLYCLAVMFTIWCTWNSVTSNKVSQFAKDVYSEYQLAVREFSHLTDRVTSLESAKPKIITQEVEVIKEIEVIKEVEVIKEIEVPVLLPAKQEGEE